jgi:hypothetical protein
MDMVLKRSEASEIFAGGSNSRCAMASQRTSDTLWLVAGVRCAVLDLASWAAFGKTAKDAVHVEAIFGQ